MSRISDYNYCFADLDAWVQRRGFAYHPLQKLFDIPGNITSWGALYLFKDKDLVAVIDTTGHLGFSILEEVTNKLEIEKG